MNKYSCGLIHFAVGLFVLFNSNVEFLFSQTDKLLSNDTLIIQKKALPEALPEKEIIIEFENSKLATANTRKIFNELFGQYISIKDALVYNDQYNASRNTIKLLDDMKAKAKNSPELNKDERWLVFLKNYDNIKSKVESANFISEQRFIFSEITNGLRSFIKQYGLYDKTIYLMQCRSDRQPENANWFSDTKDNKNPYLGLLNDTACAHVLETWIFK
ncbi:MAG: hypothetical protein HGGPFJEG_02496 [Ignavibacteria bacterium]|nr:hypothetical protein [Ignavibacteria bacterium]